MRALSWRGLVWFGLVRFGLAPTPPPANPRSLPLSRCSYKLQRVLALDESMDLLGDTDDDAMWNPLRSTLGTNDDGCSSETSADGLLLWAEGMQRSLDGSDSVSVGVGDSGSVSSRRAPPPARQPLTLFTPPLTEGWIDRLSRVSAVPVLVLVPGVWVMAMRRRIQGRERGRGEGPRARCARWRIYPMVLA